MIVETFASGSKGNSYYVSDGETALLLEAGLRPSAMKSAVWQKGYYVTNIDGCLVSHEHSDHSASASYLSLQGVPIFASQGTLKILDGVTTGKVMKAGEQKRIKTFDVLPFKVEHDAIEPLGFLIQSRVTGEKLLYATDTYYLKIKIPAVDYLMIEANYDKDIAYDNMTNGKMAASLMNRIMESHFSIEHVEQALHVADLSRLQAVYLLHLSDSNSNAEDFKKRIQKITGVPVYVC